MTRASTPGSFCTSTASVCVSFGSWRSSMKYADAGWFIIIPSNLSCSHQSLAAGEGLGRGLIIGLLRQQHLVMSLAGGNHRETILQRCDTAVEQHRALDRDHLLDGTIEIGRLGDLETDRAIGFR